MPEYIYIDEAKHTQNITHRMLYSTGIVCSCGLPMHRKPQGFYVNWAGPAPSKGEVAPAIREHLAHHGEQDGD